MRFLALSCLVLSCTAAWADDAVTSGPDSPLPPDLGTRKAGVDWPRFLGPTGDGVSPETGLVAPWPKEGPRIVWQVKARRRLRRRDDQPRPALPLRPRQATSTASAASRARRAIPYGNLNTRPITTDLYNYSGGPRCCPVVDGDRVYLLRPRGHAALPPRRGRQGDLERRHRRRSFGVVQNFFGVGSTPVIEGDLLIVQVGGSPERHRPTTRPTCDLPGHRTAASSPSTSTPARSSTTSPTSWPAIPRRCWPRSAAGAGASCSRAAA